MTIDLRAQALTWLAAERPAVVVEVLRTRGSAPRDAGARMLVAADAVVGTIGGGHLELDAIASARQLLAGQPDVPRERHIALGPTLGQCCGGSVTLGWRPLAECAPAEWAGEPPLFALQLYGAGHVGRAIAHLLETLPCRVQWIDARAEAFPDSGGAPHIERLCVEPVEAEVRLAPAGAFYLVLTHSHDLDLVITEAVLRRGDFGYLGLIGSETKRARFVRRHEQRGIAPAQLERMRCPIGVEGITGKQPEIVALAVVAELLQAASARG